MFGSLRSRIAISNLIITLFGLLALMFVFFQLLQQQAVSVERGDVSRQADFLKHDLSQQLALSLSSQFPPAQTYAYISHDSRLLSKRIVYLSNSGACAFDSAVYQRSGQRKKPPNTRPCGVSSAGWAIAKVGTPGVTSKLVKRGGKTYLVYQEALSHKRLRLGAVVLVTKVSDITPQTATLVQAFVYAMLTAAIVWLLIGLYFAYTVSRPLVRITQAARAMAGGDYDQVVSVPQGGEIGELARSFNYMVTQVRASNQLLKDFVANVSHDLRTPLTLISGYAGSVLDGTARNEAEVIEAVDVIAGEATRMQRLVDDLLQLTRLESGLRKFDQRPLAMREVVERTIRRVTAARPGRTVANNVAADLPLAYADEELIERVLMNLLSNALEHTPPEGSVSVTGSARRGWVEISVIDTGSGIAEQDQSRVFERFYRADRGRSRDSGHSGLGLPIVKEIVEAHGGALQLRSVPGRGSTFIFTIPRAAISHPLVISSQ